jgi:hypothetical protein
MLFWVEVINHIVCSDTFDNPVLVVCIKMCGWQPTITGLRRNTCNSLKTCVRSQ